MKHLIISAVVMSFSFTAFATKRSNQKKPVALECSILSVDADKNKEPGKVKEIQGSDFIIVLNSSGSNNYRGAEKLYESKEKVLEVSATVTDHGFKNTIKMQVKRMAEKAVIASGFGDNTADLISREVEVILSKREVMVCELIEKTKPQSGHLKDEEKEQK